MRGAAVMALGEAHKVLLLTFHTEATQYDHPPSRVDRRGNEAAKHRLKIGKDHAISPEWIRAWRPGDLRSICYPALGAQGSVPEKVEAQCLTILGNCRRVMTPKSRLLIIEMVLPTGSTPHLGKMFDMVMFTVPGGRERTEPEYCELLEKAGFRFTQVSRPHRQSASSKHYQHS
jgi:hypothetical protein